eukprot:TRINITY_DN1120_c0_g1_i1.p1 TRINITY_DN1120_c0_g1~~TRINITY_DN1120_c0_g1_i1.p1  ORF type:complete len:2706 (-),score=337.05 TRINITY_DN1120_c0_g1_i1:1316-9433(-)
MASSTRHTPDPNTLIATILTHLPSFQSKPEIAAAAFQTIRRASQTSNVQHIAAALLVPLTALSFNSTSATVRSHAANICVFLLRCLVQRRLRNLVAIYVEDTVRLAHEIVAHDAGECIPCSFPNFTNATVPSTVASVILPTLPQDILHLPIASVTLESLFHLLARLIPSSLPIEQLHSQSESETSQIDDVDDLNLAQTTSDAVKLWNCVGARAQNKVLNLAASRNLLAGRCGYEVAMAAVHLLERAFDPSACYMVPPALRANLCIIVNQVLRVTYSPQQSAHAQQIRAALYRLCQLSDSSGRIDSVTWSECGIREAALPETDLGLQLRSFSKSGLVHPCVLQAETVKKKHPSEPPLKRRRIGDIDDLPNTPPQRTLESAERNTQNTASDYQRMTVHGLFKSVNALPSTDVCATQPQSMLLLANACCLASDSIRNNTFEQEDQIDSIREWLLFASSLSQIGQDLVGNGQNDFQNRALGALVVFARGCLRLALCLTELKSHLDAMPSTVTGHGLEFIDTTIMGLLSVVANVYTYGSVCIEESDNPYPALPVQQLVRDIMKAIREERIQSDSIMSALRTCCERFMQGVFSGTLAIETKCIVLPEVLEMSRYLKEFHPGVPIETTLGEICNYISNLNPTQNLARGCLELLTRSICFKVRCDRVHEIKRSASNENFCKENPRLDERSWSNVYSSLKKLSDSNRNDVNSSDFFNCVGVLSLHSPRAMEETTLDFLVSFMQKPNITLLSSNTKLLPVLLKQSERRFLPTSERDDIDPEDPDGLETPGSFGKKKVDNYANFGIKVCELTRMYINTIIEGAGDQKSSSFFNLFGSLLSSSCQISSLRMFNEVITGLLVATIAELNPLSVEESQCRSAQTKTQYSLDGKKPCLLTAWNHILMTACVMSNQYSLPMFGTNGGLKLGGRRSDRNHGVKERRSLNLLVYDFLNPRLREILPQYIKQLLNFSGFSQRMAELVSEGDKNSFWGYVIRHIVVHLLKEGDRSTLERVAEKVHRPMETLVERASADVLALAFMNKTSGLSLKSDGSHGLILEMLGVSLEELVKTRFGKIVQRLVMEFGGPKEMSAKHGLVALSAFMPNRNNIDPSMEQIAGVLINNNFMLVMDALNRGFFSSKTTMQERKRHLRRLEAVLVLCSDQLHLFVPKVMATLKMALDVTKIDKPLYRQTLTLWKSFLRLLGPLRLVPHLGTVFAILMPVRYDEGNMLLTELKKVINSVNSEHLRDKPSLLLLLRIMRQAVFSDKDDSNKDCEWLHLGKILSIRELHDMCRNVESIIGHHENESIEAHASRYLLGVLRNHRHIIKKVIPGDAEQSKINRKKEFVLLTGMLETLVTQLVKTKSVDCQDVLIQCIGEIGAIDPGLLPQKQKTSSLGFYDGREVKQSYPKSVHGYATVLLNEFLVAALRKGEKQESSKSQFNRVGLVIQELLRVCGCKKSTPSTPNSSYPGKASKDAGEEWEAVLARLPAQERATLFWESLPSTTKDAVQPYLAVPFDVKQYCIIFGENAERSVSPACQPVWSKVRALVPLGRGVTAQEWIRQISVQLVDFIGRQGQFGGFLKALRPIIRYEDQVNNYIFPLVVITALDLEHDLKVKKIKEFLIREIKEVLREATSPQSVFDLLDTLRTWRDRRSERHGAQTYRSSYSRPIGSNNGQSNSRKRIPVEKFMDMAVVNDPLTNLVDLFGRESRDLSLLTQARAALASRSHYRAIMLAEYHIRNTRAKTGYPGWPSFIGVIRGRARKSDIYLASSETHALEVLQQAFANIEDVPSMEGIAKLRRESTLTEIIRDSEAAGKYDEALTTYEHALALDPQSAVLHNGFLSCLMILGHWETMLSHAEGLMSSSQLHETKLRQTAKAHGIAAAWRLGRWERLEHFRDVLVETSPLHASEEQTESPWMLGYTTHFANMLLCFQNKKLELLEEESSLARRHLIQPLVRAARESYHRSYPIITLVHCLSEAEDAARYRLSSHENSSAEVRSANAHNTAKDLLIHDAKRIQCATRSLKVREPLLSSRRVLFNLLGLPDESAKAHLELAKIAKEGDNLKAASASAFRALMTENLNSDVIHAVNIESGYICRAQGDVSDAVLTAKREVERLRRNLDGCIHEGRPAEQQNIIKGQLCTALVLAGTGVIRSFAKALSNGHKRIFEALPRMLTVWFDFHTALNDEKNEEACLPYEPSVQKEIRQAISSIPAYMWMTAIPQLMSRILHARKQVRDDLRNLLATIVCHFPDQSFWMILPSSQLKNQERKRATGDIMSAAVSLLKKRRSKESRDRAKAFKQRASVALNTIRCFVNICIMQLPKELRGKKENCAKEFLPLKKILKSKDNPKLIIPTLQSLTVQLPDESGAEHRPFATEAVRISDIEDEVLVMSSLMRPRRISLIGSDGLEYRYLAKRENQGDMRKDSRMVEFLTVVNRLLARDEGARGKKLELKTYAVVPLSEETGMIEWVNDLEALRNVVRSEHNWLGPLPEASHILRQYENAATKRQFLEEWAFEKFPPVMDRYFVRKFGGGGEARAWLRARNAWTESCAVWSMAGYIVGLGDRHGENLLVESTSGRCVHVDFAMLFDKGQTLKVPEIVPFRLTQNMVTVMGVAGYEGVFRAVAETVLAALRRDGEAVLGVLESFLHDPLAEWRGGEGGGGDGGSREGREMRATVKAKLRGWMEASALALSINGQVERLIQQATDVERLSGMYIWWAAWI